MFVDDNRFERELVRQTLPMVAVPELPEEPARFARTVPDAGYFEGVEPTEEDPATHPALCGRNPTSQRTSQGV
ncbi:hypothetical protein ACRAWD_04340 [Caulobacter segnis]